MNAKVYVEGGGDRRESRARCRKGFSCFFHKAALAGKMPRVIACGGRHKTYERFRTAIAHATTEVFVVLLVDSEEPVTACPWRHVRDRDNWSKPPNATDDNVHFMVQCMESWFLADKDALASYFGTGFAQNALPGHANIEEVSKTVLMESLKRATRASVPKGKYQKGKHSFDILSTLDPQKVTAASPHAKRLLSTLLIKLSE